jgi:drug/metabolite transporter (DMT)-like permease
VSADVKALTNLGAAVAALITALSGLAVTGLLERAQRDEGGLLLLAFVLVVFAAVVWVAAALFEGPRNVFQIIAVVMFGAGLLVGIGALIKTQDITLGPVSMPRLTKKASLLGQLPRRA